MAELTYADAMQELVALGFTLTDCKVTLSRGSGDYTINGHRLTNHADPQCLGNVEIYDRRQYTDVGPEVGMIIKATGMSYGSCDTNHRCSSLSELLYLIA